jgi:hypothetical protein
MPINKTSVSLEILTEQIRIGRHRMQQLWDQKGYTDADVLNASIELDGLLNQYQRLEKEIQR